MTSARGLREAEAAESAQTQGVASGEAAAGAEPRGNPSRPVERWREPNTGLPRTRGCGPSRSRPNYARAIRASRRAKSLRANRRGSRGNRPIHWDEHGRRLRVRLLQSR